MKGKKHSPEQIVRKLREADRLLAEGASAPLAFSPQPLRHPNRERCLSRKPLRLGRRRLKRLKRAGVRGRDLQGHLAGIDRPDLLTRHIANLCGLPRLDGRPSKMSLCLSPSTCATVPTMTPSEVTTFHHCPIYNHETGSGIVGHASTIETLSKRERKARHLAAAMQIEQAFLSEQEVVEVLASHYLAAYETAPEDPDADEIKERAGDLLARAGERAASLAASEEAEHYFEQAASLAGEPHEQARLLERSGEMALRAGRSEQAKTRFEQALALFEDVGERHQAARLAARLGEVEWRRGQLDEALERMERAFAELEGEGMRRASARRRSATRSAQMDRRHTPEETTSAPLLLMLVLVEKKCAPDVAEAATVQNVRAATPTMATSLGLASRSSSSMLLWLCWAWLAVERPGLLHQRRWQPSEGNQQSDRQRAGLCRRNLRAHQERPCDREPLGRAALRR
jgi:tetratricopeptide (TPR) repeat protein